MDGSECLADRVRPKDGTNRQPCNWFHGGRCLMSPSPTRRCSCSWHTCRGLQHPPSPYKQWELCRYPVLSSIPVDENRERTVDSNQRTIRRIWRNKGASLRSGHLASDGQRLPSVDHPGCHIPSCRLFICVQRHIRCRLNE